MKEKMLGFLRGVDNELSSKRLKGLSSGFIFDLLNLVGALTFLIDGKNSDFISLLWMYGAYSLALLGASVFERKYRNKQNNIN
jgi:hypothetical protein